MNNPTQQFTNNKQNTYLEKFNGSFNSLLQWDDLTEFWRLLSRSEESWYIYTVGKLPPTEPTTSKIFISFIEEIDKLLRREHDSRICGIVYSDNSKFPSIVKIYDPNNLGISCGSSETPPLPGWVLSLDPPEDLEPVQILPNNRKRWWSRVLGN
ncbi:MAG: hypothetical protein HOM84_00750 [Thiotrichales bacterium]|jgi:hypothetical protein|nr:hypothetical protein [Thiotrichales bacterium]MBT3613840.1 hypothetical protein [Thiotrichales bacterium]MBT3752845.1 hypothetical protein [Thiotrichales bacterium]MBT3838247.1 hypothetical protein [Thiotrichales bacterium]MBT4151448.1 hypothetical protein [Thiotrichales bacterium]